MTHLRAGSASDVGQLRSNNQDSKLVVDDLSLFAVADGMGGHQGGEVASAIAISTLEDVVTAPTSESLVEAVKEANRRIFAHAGGAPDLRGMGTTLVAIALVDQGADTEELTWVNVGDSRAYVLRDGQLIQLSQDHSLVEDLRRGGQLSAEEAAVHPQRNILTRALGIDAEVEVDWKSVEPFRGDRYLLCSDGLFNEVDTEAIIDVLTVLEDPDAAAAELVRRANDGGGRDNITCVIVDVIDDDGRAQRAAALGGDGASSIAALSSGAGGTVGVEGAQPVTVEVPTETADGPGADDDTTPPDGIPAPPPPPTAPPASAEPGTDDGSGLEAGASAYPVEGEPPIEDDELPFGRPTTDLYGDMDQVGGRHRAVTALIALVVLAVVAGAVVLGLRYLDSDGYFVRAEGERVVIYQGKPGGGILFDAEEKAVGTTPVEELTAEDRSELARTPEFDSLADARSRVNTWETRARQAEDEAEAEAEAEPSTTTTTDSAPTTESGARPVPQAPADQGTITTNGAAG